MHKFLLIEESFARKNKQSLSMHIMALLLLALGAGTLFIKGQTIIASIAALVILIIIFVLISKKDWLKNGKINMVFRYSEALALAGCGIAIFINANKISGAGFILSSIMLMVTGFYEMRIAGERFLHINEDGLQFTGRKPQSVTWAQVQKVIFTPNLVSITLSNNDVVQKTIENKSTTSTMEVMNQYCAEKINGKY